MRRDPDGLEAGWLASSWTDSEGFFRALMSLSDSRGGPIKSAFAERYDLYHDAVERHLGSEQPAFRCHHRQLGWQAFTYESIHARCGRLAQVWVECGVEPGTIVGLFLPVGVDYLVALCTAWRLGACVCPIPLYGSDYSVTRRLTDAGPAFVATTAGYQGFLEAFADIFLPVNADEDAVGARIYQRSYTYASGEVCALLYSPLRTEHDVPVELTCDDAYLRGLRDGLLVYELDVGEDLAAPGFPDLQYQPALLTAVLLAGGCFVDISMRALRAEPGQLMNLPLGSLGLTVEVRDLLLHNAPPRPPAWQRWFRNPEQVTDWTVWQDFIDTFQLKKKPASNVIVEAAAGGALLYSRVTSGDARMRALMNIHPAAGVPWLLQDANAGGQEAVSDYGLFAHGAEEPVASHVLYAQLRGRDGIYMGNPDPRRDGWVYPRIEVVEAIAELPYVEAASVVEVPSGANYHYRFALLVFTGYHGVVAPALDSARRREIEVRIDARMGELFAPDQIRLFPLFARMADGGADDDWCRLQFYRGDLHRKSGMPLFARLTTLRQSVRASTPAEDGQ